VVTDGEVISLDALDSGATGETVSLDEFEVEIVDGTDAGVDVGLDALTESGTDTTFEVVDEDPAVARARAAGAAARAAANAGTLVPSTGSSVTLETVGGAGEVISLTELGEGEQVDLGGLPEVELVGSGELSVDGSELISLDDLDQPSDTVVLIDDSNTVANGEVVVQRGDTLGTIAENVAGGDVSPQQMMMALLAANESAFINGNINLVKAGATLRIPTNSEARALSQAEALASIGDQNRLWQEYRDSVRSGQRATQVARASQAASAASDTPAANTADATDDAAEGLGPQAAAILENARTEVLRRDELSIVADNAPTTTAASATSDESTANDSNRLGEINRKLQLAREELASSRRESGDLDEQSAALQNTGENLDTLVTLQQNDIAKLEAQLEAAKVEADAANASASAEALAAAAAAATATGAGAAADAASDAASGLVGGATELAEGASDLVGGAAETASNAAEGAMESVELVGDDASTAAATTAAAAAAATTAAATNASNAASEAAEAPKGWLEGFMASNLKWIPIGLGGLAALFLGGTLFLRRRKGKDIDESELDDVEFLDEMDAADGTAAGGLSSAIGDGVDSASDAVSAGVGGVAAAGGAGVAAAAAAVGMGGSDDNNAAVDAVDDTFASESAFSSDADAFDSSPEDMDHDDTISEVDVYLAYGLHGQAEELLTKALDRDDSNPEYHTKLLETYAAQGNSEGYGQVAAQFHNKFGGSHEAWAGVAARGIELDPGNELYAGAAGDVAAVGVGRFDEAQSLGSDDFNLGEDGDSGISSISRGGSGASDDAHMAAGSALDDGDETELMDQSIDPAFAFDEADLEATGDFSQIAGEISADDTGSLDFPTENITDAASGIAGTVGDQASDAMNDMSLDVPSLDASGLDMPSLEVPEEEITGAAAAADDLTLDLNQLSGDMELDSTELLDDSLNEVDGLSMPSTDTSDDTLLSGTDSLESVDEMDTMMDLAKAYIDMGDNDSASSALDEIVKSGNPEQKSEAETLKQKIS